MQVLWLLIKLIFWLTVIVAFLFSSSTHLILAMELRLAALQGKETRVFPWLILIKSFFVEFLCVLITCFLYPFRSWTLQPTNPSRELAGLPILLVHGYLHHEKSWIWFSHQLQKKPGIGPLYTLNLTPPFGPIAKLAEQVKNKVEEIQAKTENKPIILIGHSMGGLVSSYFCEYLAKPQQIATLISLGTPFKGSLTAALTSRLIGQEMVPQSAFLTALSEKIQKSPIPYFSIASKIDNMVIPWESAILYERSSKQTAILEDSGHLRLLISPEVVELVAKWITSLTTLAKET